LANFNMRAVIIALLVAVVFADDKTSCEKKCAEKYAKGDIRNACNTGCDARRDISEGPLVFVECYRNCDNQFNQGNVTENESEAHAACSYACSLPMSRSVFMSVKYSNDEKPVVEVIRREGDDVVDRASHMGSPNVDQFISGIFGGVNRIPVIQKPASTQHSQSEQDRNSSMEDYSNTAIVESAHSRMMRMHERMNEMLAAFTKHFFDGIRRQMQRHRHLFAERPNGHDFFSHIGPEVDNVLADGEPIIITHSLTRDEDNEDMPRPIKGFANKLMFSFVFLVLVEHADGATSHRSTSLTSPGALQIKKVPIDGWVDHSEPSGVPPPAYDQVSIHSLQKQQQHPEETQTKVDTVSPNPASGQK
uniref:Kazal-like domain-containing protein n=1 Tax=Angiostrongylus cantonensis TaxID=6313 RepID=A0A0K0CYC8_ANGCA